MFKVRLKHLYGALSSHNRPPLVNAFKLRVEVPEFQLINVINPYYAKYYYAEIQCIIRQRFYVLLCKDAMYHAEMQCIKTIIVQRCNVLLCTDAMYYNAEMQCIIMHRCNVL